MGREQGRAGVIPKGVPCHVVGAHPEHERDTHTPKTPSPLEETMKLLPIRNDVETRRHAAGSVLVEFAFIALAFYLLFAGTIELGRMITMSQAVQNAARVGARELALVPLPPTATFQEALDNPLVKARIYDPLLLAVDVSGGDPNTDAWPIINRMLLPVMNRSRVGTATFLHFPGAILQVPGGGFTVGVPKVIARGADGTETIRWLPVLEEVRANPGDPNSGPFSLASTGPERGLVALRINCPYQATTLTAYKVEGGAPSMTPIQANDGAVTAVNAAPDGATPVSITPNPSGEPGLPSTNLNDGGFNTGPYGLGNLYAMGLNGQPVRPFRRLIATQSIFRREVFAQ